MHSRALNSEDEATHVPRGEREGQMSRIKTSVIQTDLRGKRALPKNSFRTRYIGVQCPFFHHRRRKDDYAWADFNTS